MKHERGSAVLVVLTLLAALTALVAVNETVVRQLRQELRRVETQQQQRYQIPRD